MDPITITREALYERVWAAPLNKVAVELGILAQSLSALCDAHRVARPPQGHWTRLELGKPVEIIPLEPASPGSATSITIVPHTPREKRAPSKEAPAIPGATGELSGRLLRPHRVVAGWIETRQRQVREKKEIYDHRLKRLVRPVALTEADRRRLRVADALFKALERRGVSVGSGDNREVLMTLGAEQIEFRIRYRLKRGRRDLTKDEMRWRGSDAQDWAYELYETDSLLVELKTWLPRGTRCEWEDSKRGTIEEQFDEVINGIMAAFPALKALTEQRAAEKRSYEQRAQERQERENAQKLDAARFRRFLELAGYWRETELARAFLARLRDALPDNAPPVAETEVADWLGWAQRKIEEHDRLANDPRAILVSLAEVTRWSYRDV